MLLLLLVLTPLETGLEIPEEVVEDPEAKVEEAPWDLMTAACLKNNLQFEVRT